MAVKRLDLIDRRAFIEDVKTEIMNLYLDGMKGTPRPRDELYDLIDRINEQPTVNAVEVPCKVGGMVFVDSRTLPTHKLDIYEEEIPEFMKATVVSIRQNSKGWFFKISVFANWLVEMWGECGRYEVGCQKVRYFTYPACAINKTVFMDCPNCGAKMDGGAEDGRMDVGE